MNPYKLDRENNIIKEKIMWCVSKQDAIKIARSYLAECMNNDVVKVKNFRAY
jgi:hypothetical protein